MDFLALVSYAAQAAIAVIILWYVVEFLPIPQPMKRAVQMLIALVAILSVLSAVLAKPVSSGNSLVPLRPLSPSNPSIIR